MKKFFEDPNVEKDREVLEEEEKRLQRRFTDWDERMWRPRPKPERNEIRILPARKGSGASYHLRMGKHFIHHDEDGRIESFICNRETYGLSCVACEEYFRLVRKGKREEALNYKVNRRGVFNIIDRAREEEGVKIYEAPIQGVWQPIISIIATRGRMSNLFDQYDEKGRLVKPGRDVCIIYDPNAVAQAKYLVYPLDESPLGTPEQIEAWVEQMIDLLPENLYPPVDEVVAQIKTFGTKEERDLLRMELQRAYGQSGSDKEEKKEEAAKAQTFSSGSKKSTVYLGSEKFVKAEEEEEEKQEEDDIEFPPAEEDEEESEATEREEKFIVVQKPLKRQEPIISPKMSEPLQKRESVDQPSTPFSEEKTAFRTKEEQKPAETPKDSAGEGPRVKSRLTPEQLASIRRKIEEVRVKSGKAS